MPTIRLVVKTDFPKATAEVLAKADLVIGKAAHDVEARAKAVAPVRTGLLRNSITTKHDKPLVWEIESPVFYSVYQEFGTRYIHPRPYMSPSLEMVASGLQFALRNIA